MKLRHHLEYGAVVALAASLRALPRGAALAAGAALGQLGWWLRIRRSVVLANLAQALPAKTDGERRRIAARAARNFGRTVAEFVRFAGSDRRRVGELVHLEGVAELRAALASGTGAIVVTAHLGAWALYVTALAAAGIPSALLVGRQHNPKVQRFILGIPGDAVEFVPKSKGAPRDVLRCLREGRAVVMVADHLDAAPARRDLGAPRHADLPAGRRTGRPRHARRDDRAASPAAGGSGGRAAPRDHGRLQRRPRRRDPRLPRAVLLVPPPLARPTPGPWAGGAFGVGGQGEPAHSSARSGRRSG
jgi:hypothetical protein